MRLNPIKNKATVAIGVIVLFSIFALPSLSLAEVIRTRGNFCENILNPASPIRERVVSINTKLGIVGSERLSRFEKNINEKSERRDESHRSLDAKRLEQYEKLKAQATTDIQENAVADFVSMSDGAIQARREATNNAEENFVKSVKDILEKRSPIIASAAKNFRYTLDALVANATTDCKAGVEDIAAHDTFMKGLKKAHTTFVSERGDPKVWRSQIIALNKTLKASVASAEATFRSQIAAAEETLEAAFKQ